MSIKFQFYPKNVRIPTFLSDVVSVFKDINEVTSNSPTPLKSNDVLKVCTPFFLDLGYRVEGRHNEDQFHIEVPVLFGKNNSLEKIISCRCIS